MFDSNFDLPNKLFRANAAWRLVPYDRLSPVRQRQIAAQGSDGQLYGLLLPAKEGEGNPKVIDRDIALLLFTMREFEKLPTYFLSELGLKAPTVVGRLVLDGILEVEHLGSALSGVAAAEALGMRTGVSRPNGYIAQLSHDAMLWGDELCLEDTGELADRLYRFNSFAADRYWRDRIGLGSTAEYLGTSAVRRLDRRSGTNSAESASLGWLSWSFEHEHSLDSKKLATYKLYVSPHPAILPEVFAMCADCIPLSKAHAMKVGANIFGVLRPDKLVLYFRRFEDLERTGADLSSRLLGVEVHGVPFTAEFDSSGVLSWGMDPPIQDHVSPAARESWRIYVIRCIASSIRQGRREGHDNPVSFACARLRLEGIDTNLWTPSQAFASTR